MFENDPDDVLEQGKVPLLIKTVPEIKALVSLLNCQICYQLMVRLIVEFKANVQTLNVPSKMSFLKYTQWHLSSPFLLTLRLT